MFHPHLCDTEGEFTNSGDDANALGDRNCAARIQQVENVRALQHLIVGGKNHVARLEETLAFALVQVEEFPQHADVGQLEVVFGKLALVFKTHLAIADSRGPLDVVDAVDILEEGDDPLKTVRQLGGDQIEIEAAALLEVGKLRDLET